MLDLFDCTWKQIAEIDKSRSILFITMAPIEEHSFLTFFDSWSFYICSICT